MLARNEHIILYQPANASQLDVGDFEGLPSKVSEMTKSFPTIDTVFLNAGIMSSFSFAGPSTSDPKAIAAEIDTNLTAPLLLTRLLLPHLLALKKPASVLFTSSGLGFLPFGVSDPVSLQTWVPIVA